MSAALGRKGMVRSQSREQEELQEEEFGGS
jgi:hypothetical protein